MTIINVTKLNTENFDEFTSDGLALVDVKAEWCGPCKVISPIIDELSSEYSNVRFGKIDSDESTDKVRELGVRNIPTLLLYKDGKIVERHVGMVSKQQIKDLIDKNLES